VNNQTDGADFASIAAPHFSLTYSVAPSVVPYGWWRSVDNSQNVFVVQSFVDELAASAGKDPLEFRLEILGETRPVTVDGSSYQTGRMKAVLLRAAEAAGWGKPPAAGRALGMACHFCYDSYVAEVAEVSLADAGAVRVHRVVCALDCGLVVNPDIVRAQIEGAVVYGLSAALKGEITLKSGRVEQGNFNDYPILTMEEMPVVESHLIASRESPGGVGETALPPIAPAVANAIFAATGKRIRRLPMRL